MRAYLCTPALSSSLAGCWPARPSSLWLAVVVGERNLYAQSRLVIVVVRISILTIKENASVPLYARPPVSSLLWLAVDLSLCLQPAVVLVLVA